MEVLDIPYENSFKVYMQDQQYTAGHKEIPDKLFSNIISNWVIHFKSSEIALHRTLNRFSTLFGNLQVAICRFKQVTHHCSTPSPPVLPSSELQWQFSDWTPITVTNFPPLWSRSHIALFPKQCGLCCRPQRHFSIHKSLSTIITRDLYATDCAQKAEHVKKERTLRFTLQDCSKTWELATPFSVSLECCKNSNKGN